MKILFIFSEPPYPDVNGIRLASYNPMRLMAEDHDVAMATLIPPETKPYDLEAIRPICKNVLSFPLRVSSNKAIMARAIRQGTLFYMERWRNEKFRSALNTLVKKFQPDVIHYDWILMTQYWDCCPPGIGSVASVNDCVTLSKENQFQDGQYLWGTPAYFYRKIQYWQVRRFEKAVYPKFDAIHLMTHVDAHRLKELNPAIKTVVIPNGTRMDLSSPDTMNPSNRDLITVMSSLDKRSLISFKRFLAESWPSVRAKFPNVTLHVIGRKTAAIESCNKIIEKTGGVVFEGFVDHLRDAYRMGSISLNLTNKNCGLINKVIEGMAAQQCVIGFRLGFSGLPEAVDGKNCLMANDYKQFAEKIIHALNDTTLRQRIQQTARETAEENFSWDSRKPAFEILYRQASKAAKEILDHP